MRYRIILFCIFILVLTLNAHAQLPFGHGISYTVVDDTSDIDLAQSGIVWYSKIDSSLYFTNGTVKYRVPAQLDSILKSSNLIKIIAVNNETHYMNIVELTNTSEFVMPTGITGFGNVMINDNQE